MSEAQQHRLALPQGTRIGNFEFNSVLGHGGFGLTYKGRNLALDIDVAIKEYLPADLAVREQDLSVVPKTAQAAKDFDWGLKRFEQEAKILARFDHRHIIKVHPPSFKEHGTAYMVMDHVKGENLSEYLTRKGTLSEAELKGILYPLLDGLEEVHGAGILHRDIKPANIMIRDEDDSPVLIDFGTARRAMGERRRSSQAILTRGYAPIEQYSSVSNQGAWTDLYALGAVCYRALTGQVPDDATDRVRRDSLVPTGELCSSRVSAELLSAVDWALQIKEEDRPQSVAEWRSALSDSESARREQALEEEHKAESARREQEKRKLVQIVAQAVEEADQKWLEKQLQAEEARPNATERRRTRERQLQAKRVSVVWGVVVLLVAGLKHFAGIVTADWSSVFMGVTCMAMSTVALLHILRRWDWPEAILFSYPFGWFLYLSLNSIVSIGSIIESPEPRDLLFVLYNNTYLGSLLHLIFFIASSLCFSRMMREVSTDKSILSYLQLPFVFLGSGIVVFSILLPLNAAGVTIVQSDLMVTQWIAVLVVFLFFVLFVCSAVIPFYQINVISLLYSIFLGVALFAVGILLVADIMTAVPASAIITVSLTALLVILVAFMEKVK